MLTTDAESGKVADAIHTVRYNVEERNPFSGVAAADTRRERRSAADTRDSEHMIVASRINLIDRTFLTGRAGARRR
jgi:hypothetical protein